MKALCCVLAGVSCLGSLARADAPLVFCVGTTCGGGGPRAYAYEVDAASYPMMEFSVGTGDLNRLDYANVLIPPGWNFAVEEAGMSHACGIFTPHGQVPAGPCYSLTCGRAHWWTDDPANAVELFVFGFDHAWTPEDVGWELNCERPGPPPQQYTFIEAWDSPVGTGAGPLHGPYASRPGGPLNLGAAELVRASGVDIAVPGWSVPSFAYWDGDGLKDLIVGEGGSTDPGKVRVYLNDGAPGWPHFSGFFCAQSNGVDLVVPPSGCLGAFPRAVYWDADARKDLLVGQADGRVKLFLNINTDDDPRFDGGTFIQVGGNDLSVGSRATPTVVEWNNDCRKDLVVGALDGRIHVFINAGTHSNPVFNAVQYAQLNGADLVVPTGRSSPVIRDLDGDGKKDLLTGNTEGQLLFYSNTGSDAVPSFSGYVLVTADGVPIDLAGQPRSRIFVCDWTDDGLPDVLIGSRENGLTYGLVRLYQGVPMLIPKWSQRLGDCSSNFDAASDLWWPDPASPTPSLPVTKWEQDPNPEWSGIAAHDWMEPPGDYHWITLADQWRCEGGLVTDLHWWGNYELMSPGGPEWRGSGIDHFHLSIHANVPGDPWCLPGAELWSVDLPFSGTLEQPTGLVNVEGSPIYRYEFDLPEPFPQTPGEVYWLDIEAHAVDPLDPPHWRWQEAARTWPPILCPAAQRLDGGTWDSIGWPNFTYSDLAFRVTSVVSEVDKVVADDFHSDGRPVRALRWWGSYFDERYAPDSGDLLHQVDGWLIAFHWANVNTYPECPPDLLFDPPPTVLGVYFAPVGQVGIAGLDCTDCLGHALYEYVVNLDRCCLLCSEPDPRSGRFPAQPGEFRERNGYRYWLSMQAVTGVEWIPPECQMAFTGHLPSDLPGNDGHFWGWHSTQVAPGPVPNDEACAGRIIDFMPYPPHCWDYGEWSKQDYECPLPPLPVHMSFQLLAPPCVGDVDGDGDTDLSDLGALLAAYGTSVGDPRYNPDADFDGDGHVGLSDLAHLLADYGCGRFVP